MKPVAMKTVSKSSQTTIRDVARSAGVSPGTVSRVLNDSPLVTEKTRQRVLRAIDELDYHPNLIARMLSLGKTLHIGTIVPFFTRPAEVERLRGIVSALSQSQYDLVIYNVETVDQRDTYFDQVPHKERVDGMMVISLPPKKEDIGELSEADIPIVFVDVHNPELSHFDHVLNDDVAGGYLATNHLIHVGHKKIGFIGDKTPSPFGFTSSRDRFMGYCNALEQANISINEAWTAFDEHDRYTAHLLAEEMLKSPDPPTAIFAASDTQAIGVITASRSCGINIPQELSIIGFDDIEVAEYLDLTTVRQQLFESGQIGVELLLDRIINPDKSPVTQEIKNELIVRSTTGPPTEN